MKDIIIYGAGRVFQKLCSEKVLNDYNIRCVVDENSEKWGAIDGYIVMGPKDGLKMEYDNILVAVEKWKEISEYLINKYRIDKGRILVYDYFNRTIVSIKEREINEEQAKFALIDAERIISSNLLLESRENGEFNGFSVIQVIGKSKYVDYVKEFFSVLDRNVIVRKFVEIMDMKTKYIVTTKTWADDRDVLRAKGVRDKQILILPLSDIVDSVRVYL